MTESQAWQTFEVEYQSQPDSVTLIFLLSRLEARETTPTTAVSKF